MILAETNVHPAESQHWYDRAGNPAYDMKGANGNMRPVTLRDARKLGLLPSVTSIIRQAAAPGLERWKMTQAVLAALTHPGLKGTDDDVNMILKDAAEQGKKAAELGTIIHAALQDGDIEGEYARHVVAAQNVIDEHFGSHGWSYEDSFSHPLGFGGKVDAFSVNIVVDYKTTDKDLATIKTWPEHAYQLAAYREGMSMPQARCAIVYVAIDGSGAKVCELSAEKLEQGWRCFRALLDFFYAKTGLSR